MFISSVLSKSKNPWVMMVMKSVVSGHKLTVVRPREEARDLLIRFDPWIQRDSVYKEHKKIRSLKYTGIDYSDKL